MKKSIKKVVSLLLAFFCALSAFSADLKINASDLMIVPEYQCNLLKGEDLRDKNGFHLYIRKKPGMESVLLTETTKDPKEKSNNYAFRAKEFNSINGNEIRYLNGKVLDSPSARFSLISSTVEDNKYLGECFHIYVPETVVYGYAWTRNGEMKIEDGSFINIRAFSKKYGEYEGGEFRDNPFKVNLRKPRKEKEVELEVNVKLDKVEKKEEKPVEKKEEKKDEEFINEAEKQFQKIAEDGDGELLHSIAYWDLSKDLTKLLDEVKDEPKVEIVFAIDATGSMKDDFEELLHSWIPKLKKQVEQFKDISLGLLLYKDYGEDYNDKNLPVKIFGFADVGLSPVDQFASWLKNAEIKAGGDRPEAVYEALYACLRYFDWSPNAKKKIVLIGDAEPHPTPRGQQHINFENVMSLAKRKKIAIDCLIILDEKYRDAISERKSKELKRIQKTAETSELLNAVEGMK